MQGGFDLYKAELKLAEVESKPAKKINASREWLAMSPEQQATYEKRAEEGGYDLFLDVLTRTQLARKSNAKVTADPKAPADEKKTVAAPSKSKSAGKKKEKTDVAISKQEKPEEAKKIETAAKKLKQDEKIEEPQQAAQPKLMKQHVVDVIMKHEIEETQGYLKFKQDMSAFDIPEAEVKLAWIRLTDENKAAIEKDAEALKSAAAAADKKKD